MPFYPLGEGSSKIDVQKKHRVPTYSDLWRKVGTNLFEHLSTGWYPYSSLSNLEDLGCFCCASALRQDPPEIYDVVQLCSYCRVLGTVRGDLVQCLRAKTGASARSLGCGAGCGASGYLPFPIILSVLLSRKPPETQGKRIRCLERTMVEKNGESTPRCLGACKDIRKNRVEGMENGQCLRVRNIFSEIVARVNPRLIGMDPKVLWDPKLLHRKTSRQASEHVLD